MLHVYEDPTFIGGDPLEESSWKSGPFAESVLRAINVADSAGSIVLEVEGGTNTGLNDVLVSERIVGPSLNPLKFDIKSIAQLLSSRREVAGGTDDK